MTLFPNFVLSHGVGVYIVNMLQPYQHVAAISTFMMDQQNTSAHIRSRGKAFGHARICTQKNKQQYPKT